MSALASKLKRLAPYAALGLVLPGGFIIALLWWLYRRHGMVNSRVARLASDFARQHRRGDAHAATPRVQTEAAARSRGRHAEMLPPSMHMHIPHEHRSSLP